MIDNIVFSKKHLFETNSNTELRAQQNTNRRVVMIKGNITGNSRSESTGISARVYKNGVYGFSSIADNSSEAAEKVLKAANENALFMSKHCGKGKSILPTVPNTQFLCNDKIIDTEQKEYIEFLKSIDAKFEKKYTKLINRTLVATADSMEKYLAVSNGCDSHTILPRSYIYLMFTIEGKDGQPLELFTPIGGYGDFKSNFINENSVIEEADKLYEKLNKKADGIYPEAGIKDCILDTGELTGMLAHEAIGHTVEADLVLGGSVAAGKIGEQVGSELITLVDYANTAFGEATPLPVYVDDEGIEAKDETIIKDGVLVGYMNNRESAEHFSMIPKGNARAYGFSDEPLIRMRNTAINPGTSTIEEMIASIDDGYYFLDTNNGQADTTGEFMFGITYGYEIHHGKLGKAILDTTISGIAFNTLKTVTMVGNKIGWGSSGFCGKKQPMPVGLGGPALKCKLMVGGK